MLFLTLNILFTGEVVIIQWGYEWSDLNEHIITEHTTISKHHSILLRFPQISHCLYGRWQAKISLQGCPMGTCWWFPGCFQLPWSSCSSLDPLPVVAILLPRIFLPRSVYLWALILDLLQSKPRPLGRYCPSAASWLLRRNTEVTQLSWPCLVGAYLALYFPSFCTIHF